MRIQAANTGGEILIVLLKEASTTAVSGRPQAARLGVSAAARCGSLGW
jgi:hypothetical protein